MSNRWRDVILAGEKSPAASFATMHRACNDVPDPKPINDVKNIEDVNDSSDVIGSKQNKPP
jgi:hypothetical protein